MKKFLAIFSLVALVVMTFSFGSCRKDPAAKADEAIEKVINSQIYPQTQPDGSVVTKVTYENKVLTYNFDVDKKTFDKVSKDSYRESLLNDLRTNSAKQKLVNKVIEAQGSIRYIYNYDGKTVDFIFLAPDLM